MSPENTTEVPKIDWEDVFVSYLKDNPEFDLRHALTFERQNGNFVDQDDETVIRDAAHLFTLSKEGKLPLTELNLADEAQKRGRTEKHMRDVGELLISSNYLRYDNGYTGPEYVRVNGNGKSRKTV